MAHELYLSGFLLTQEDWDLLDKETRILFTEMLAEEGRKPRFDQRRHESRHQASS